MGVSLWCKKSKKSIDMGYGGFARLRIKIAELIGEPLYHLYMDLMDPMFISKSTEEKDKFWETFEKEVGEMISDKKISEGIVDFLLQSDTEGKIPFRTCKSLVTIIGEYDDNIIYGYIGRSNPVKFKDFKQLLKECADQKSQLIWDQYS